MACLFWGERGTVEDRRGVGEHALRWLECVEGEVESVRPFLRWAEGADHRRAAFVVRLSGPDEPEQGRGECVNGGFVQRS